MLPLRLRNRLRPTSSFHPARNDAESLSRHVSQSCHLVTHRLQSPALCKRFDSRTLLMAGLDPTLLSPLIALLRSRLSVMQLPLLAFAFLFSPFPCGILWIDYSPLCITHIDQRRPFPFVPRSNMSCQCQLRAVL